MMYFDLLIIGAGPAGLQAAIHAARKKIKVAVIGHMDQSALLKADVENYFGLDEVKGKMLLEKGVEQAKRFGAAIFEGNAMKAEREGESFVVTTDHDEQFKSRALILATGIKRKKLDIPGDKEYLGKGVSYCASCDCNFFRGKTVAVVGDESIAAAAVVLLSEYASMVYWVSKEMKVTDFLMSKVKATKAQIITPNTLTRVVGNEVVTGIELNDGRKIPVDGVFVELGAKGSADLALELGVIPDPTGTIEVNRDMETSIHGLFACGDITGQPWQLARAVGQGCVAGNAAAVMICKEIDCP